MWDKTPDQIATKWIERYAHRNHWRVASFIGVDDLIQDGLWLYVRTVERYPNAENKRHLMALFQRTYSGHLHNLANARTKINDCPLSLNLIDDPDIALQTLVVDDDKGFAEEEFTQVIAEAPAHIAIVLRFLLDNPSILRKPRKRRRNGGRETLNERICRAMRMPVTDIVTPLRSYLAS